MHLEDVKASINNYVKQKSWYLYLPLWLLGIYLFTAVLKFNPNASSPFLVAIPSAFDFFLHEMAHIVTGFLPDMLTASAGSLSELLLGSLLVYGAFKTRCYFASLLCCMWFMLACQSAGIYMADARAQQLQLVSIGGELSGSSIVIHDWNFVFGKLHLLNQDKLIGNTVRGVGIAVGIASIIFTAWLMYKMALSKQAHALNEDEAELLKQSTAQTGTKPAPVEHYLSLSEGSLYPVPTKGRLVDYPKPNKDTKPPAKTDV